MKAAVPAAPAPATDAPTDSATEHRHGTNPFRLPDRRRGRKGPPRARRLRQRGLALRPHERRAVHGHAPRLEGLHRGRGRRAAGHERARHRRRHRRPGARLRRPRRRAGPGGAHRHQRIHAARRPRPPARRRPGHRHRRLRRRAPAVCRRHLRPRQRGLRPAQHDAQGSRAGRDVPRAAPRRPPAGAGVQPGPPRRCRSPTTGTRSR